MSGMSYDRDTRWAAVWVLVRAHLARFGRRASGSPHVVQGGWGGLKCILTKIPRWSGSCTKWTNPFPLSARRREKRGNGVSQLKTSGLLTDEQLKMLAHKNLRRKKAKICLRCRACKVKYTSLIAYCLLKVSEESTLPYLNAAVILRSLNNLAITP